MGKNVSANFRDLNNYWRYREQKENFQGVPSTQMFSYNSSQSASNIAWCFPYNFKGFLNSLFYGQLLWTIRYPYLPSRWVLLLVPDVTELNERSRGIWGFIFFFLVLITGMKEEGKPKISLCYPRGMGASPQSLWARWRNLVRVECLQMIQIMVLGFCSIGSWCWSGWLERDLKTFAHFHGNPISYFCSWCYSRKWGSGVSPRLHFVVIFVAVNWEN